MRLSLASVVALLALSGASAADVVEMPADSTVAPAEAQGMAANMPLRGMHARDVESTFGAPLEKLPPVGEPPISRWVYPDYTVYFEHQYVIHSVQKHK